MTAPPKLVDTDQTTDAPLLGNGDLGVAILGGPEAMTFILHKNEFWSLGEKKVKAMLRLSLAAPGMSGATYAMTEELGTGEVTGTFTAAGKTLTTMSWVQADDTTTNLFVTQLSLMGGGVRPASQEDRERAPPYVGRHPANRALGASPAAYGMVFVDVRACS